MEFSNVNMDKNENFDPILIFMRPPISNFQTFTSSKPKNIKTKSPFQTKTTATKYYPSPSITNSFIILHHQ